MALHDLWSYDNAPQSSTDISQGTTLTTYPNLGTYYQYTGLPGILYKNTGASATITSDGFLNLLSTSNWNPALIVQAAQVQNWTTSTQYWIGFRTKTASQGASTTRVFTVGNNLAQGSNVAILSESDFTSANAAAVNTEYYVEIFLDYLNLAYQVLINGVQVKTGTLTAAAFLAAGGSYYFWGGYNSASATAGATRSFRDFYFLDIDAVDKIRLGPIRSSPSTLQSASGSNWTLNGSPASLLAALNTPLQSPPVSTPSATSPVSNQVLTTALGTSIATGTPVLAMQGQLTLAGGTSNPYFDALGETLSEGGSTADLGTMVAAIGGVPQYNQRSSTIVRAAPDGGVWTPAKVNQTNLILTPKQLNTVLLMHADGINGATYFPDDTGRSWTANGNISTYTSQAKFGSASAYPNSTGYLSAPVDSTLLLTGTFTIELWAYLTAVSGANGMTMLSMKTANDSTHQTTLGQGSAADGLAIYLMDGKGWQQLAPASAITLNAWNHLAVVYVNGVYTGYVNGVAYGSVTSALGFGLSGGTMTIGGNSYNTASQVLGYLDEIRISRIARYFNSSFTVPTAPFVLD